MKFGVIGCGDAGVNHIESYIKKEHKVTAIYDISKDRASEVARKYGIEKVLFEEGSYKEMLNLDLDGISVSTPPYARKNIIIDCIKSNKNILVEKPLASKLEDAKEIVDVASKYNKTYGMCYNWRYTCLMGLFRDMVRGGLQDLKTLSVYHEFGFDYSKNAGWREDPKLGGGHVIELDIHCINYLRYILGDVSSVYATGIKNTINSRIYQNLDIILEHENNKTSNLLIRHGTGLPLHRYFNIDIKAIFDSEVYRGITNWDPKDLNIDYPVFQTFYNDQEFVFNDFNDEPEYREIAGKPEFNYKRYKFQDIWDNLSWDRIISDFLRSIQYDEQPWSTLMDGYQDLKVAFAIRKSLEEGRKVLIEDVVSKPKTRASFIHP